PIYLRFPYAPLALCAAESHSPSLPLPPALRPLYRLPPSFSIGPATTYLYTLSLHDALPILGYRTPNIDRIASEGAILTDYYGQRSEEHTSELQSPDHLVCRLLLEKKNTRQSQETRATAETTDSEWLSRTQKSRELQSGLQPD